MKTKKILMAAGLTIAAILIIQMVVKKKKTAKRLTVVAEEGYETAEDILFPKRKFLRLG
jgi:predicted small secreted protein